MPEPLDVLRQALADRYAIERALGHGATATVYLAQDLKHPRKVALKVLNPELSLAVRTERFLREIGIASRLNHPHILALFDSGAVGSLLYYVMPHVEGETLSERLAREGPLPVEDALGIAREVADALDYAHREGVIHRDIKPANILLARGHAWVADFGIARAIAAEDARVTDTGVAVGSPAYMSPEQSKGMAQLDGRTDIYSLGCVLYEMLAGTPPFTGQTVQSVLAQHLLDPIPPVRKVRADVPAYVERIVERALAKDVGQRFATAAEFGEALAFQRRVSRPRRPGRRGVLVRAAIVVAGVTALGAWLLLRRGPESLAETPVGTAAVTTPLDPTHIAVLYFDDLSLDGHLAHIAAGLTHDLIDALGRVSGLNVISPEGVKPFRHLGVRLDSAARALGVGTIVSGGVAGFGSRLRVSMRMVDPVSGVQLLSHTVEGPLRDVFALQNQVTEEISAGLRQRLGREVQLRDRRARTTSVAAWEYLQLADRLSDDARALQRLGQDAPAVQVWSHADSVLNSAEALDPRWTVPIVARGWLAYAVALASPAAPQPSHLLDGLGVGLRHAERALSLRSTDSEALELRGVLRARLWDLGPTDASDTLVMGAERDLLAATDAAPNLARAWHTLALLYWVRGRFADAHSAAQTALEADAYLREVQSVLQMLVFTAIHLGRYQEARSWCDQALARFPGDPRLAECGLMLLGWLARGSGGIAEAWHVLSQVEEEDSLGILDPTWAYRRMFVAAILARTGLRDSAEAVIERTRTDPRARQHLRGATLLVEAYAHLLLQSRDEALHMIRAAVESDPRVRFLAAATPWFQELHADPGFFIAIGTEPPPPR